MKTALLLAFILFQERGTVVEYSKGVAMRPHMQTQNFVIPTADQQANIRVAMMRVELAIVKVQAEQALLALTIRDARDALGIDPKWEWDDVKLQFNKPPDSIFQKPMEKPKERESK